jgi:multidrug efflux system membrane fusion protein
MDEPGSAEGVRRGDRRSGGWRRGFAVGAMLLVVAGGGFVVWMHDSRATAVAPPPQPLAVPVHAASATRADVPISLTGLGIVQAFNTVTVHVRVEGELQQVLFTEGQHVKRGDLLAVIDPRPFQATLDQAKAKRDQDKAALANARLNLKRDADLAARDYASRQVLDNQKSTVEQLVAAVAQDDAMVFSAETQLSYTRIVAPLDGRTGIRLVDQGNIVHPTDTTGLVVITQMQPISVIATLPEGDLPDVNAALHAGPVEVTASSRDGARQLDVGTLSLIDNTIDQQSGTLRLKITFPNKAGTLWPGQFVQVEVRTQVAHDAVTVPSSAIQRGPDGFFVYIVQPDDTVVPHPIQPGQIAHGRAIVEGGVEPGERVVTAGQYRLSPGTRVIVRDATTGATGG